MRSLRDLAKSDIATIELYPANDDGDQAITAECYTLSSKQWLSAKHRHKFVEQTIATTNGEIIIDHDMPLEQLKALSTLVISIDGIEEFKDLQNNDIAKKRLKDVFTNPAYNQIPSNMWLALKRLENDDKKN
jgi:hypothetical protein